MIRPLLLAAFLASSALACANEVGTSAPGDEGATETSDSRLVVEYRYGNKLTESTVRIFDSGVVLRSESACCPSRVEPVFSAPLDASRLAALLADIERVEEADETDDAADLAPKAKAGSGELAIIKASGKRVTLRAFGEKTRVNASPRSRAIVEAVNELARQKMPL